MTILKFKEKIREETLSRLERVLGILEQNGMKLNKDKCCFLTTSIKYLGFCIESEGIKKTPEKVQTIIEAKPPTDVTELRSLIGMVNHYGRFIPKLATLIEPWTKRLKKDNFKWTKRCQQTLNEIKKEIASDRVLIPYDPS